MGEDVRQEEEEGGEKHGRKYKYLFMATKQGLIKKTDLSEFGAIRSSGLIAIGLNEGDELAWVKPTTGNDEIMLVTRKARSIRFSEKDVRPMGRPAKGVIGIKFKQKDDEVIVMDVVRKGEDKLLVVSEKGYGKFTKLEEYALQGRGGQGVFTFRVTAKTGGLVSARILDHPEKEILMMSENGIAIRLPIKGLPIQHRQTTGVKLMRVGKDDKVAAIAMI